MPAGTDLDQSGSITVSQDGAVIDGLEVHGTITIKADDVTIRNTRVVGGRIEAGWGVQSGAVITDVEIDGRDESGKQIVNSFTSGIGGDHFTCLRCHIHHVGHGANIGDYVTIEDSYIHDVVYANGSHNDSIVSNGGSHMEIIGNTLMIQNTPGSSAALALYGDFDPIVDVLVEGNLIDGGGYCTYGGSVDGKPYQASQVRYIGNHFGDTYNNDCGVYGPVSAFDTSAPGNQWSGNVWDDTGKPVGPDS